MGKRTASKTDNGARRGKGFTAPKGRPTRRRNGHRRSGAMTTLQWFLLVLALVVAIVVIVVIFGPDTGSDTVPTGRANIVGAAAARPERVSFRVVR